MHCDPVRRQDAITEAAIDGEAIVACERRVADARDEIERGVVRAVLAEEDLTWQRVPTCGQSVIRVVALAVRQQISRARQVLVTGASGARLTQGRFEEEILGEVIREARAVNDVALEVLDAQDADVR